MHVDHIMFSTARSHSQPVVSETVPNHKEKFAPRQEGEVATSSYTDTVNPHLHFIQKYL